MKDGILLIDKQRGHYSSQVVREVKRVLGASKVGHAGTLDPFASGLLIVLLGRATGLARFLQQGKKRYEAALLLGTATATLDLEGKVTATVPVPRLELMHIKRAAESFVGEVSQIPPDFSAVRCGEGKRAYDLARRGIRPCLSPRKVMIHSLEILYVSEAVIGMEVVCSAGTYIRRLGSDLAESLSTKGHLISLRRTASGPFTVEQAISSAGLGEGLAERIIPMEDALADMPRVILPPTLGSAVMSGISPSWEALRRLSEESLPSGGYLRLLHRGKLAAVVRIEALKGGEERRIFFERVFPSIN